MTKMSSPKSQVRRVLVTTLCTILLASACSSSNEPDQDTATVDREAAQRHLDWTAPAPLEATCYSKVNLANPDDPMAFDVDLDSAVSCMQPHVFEALDLVPVPTEILSAEGTLNRDDLLNGGVNAQSAAYVQWAGLTCQQSLSQHLDLDGLDIAGVQSIDAGLVPMFLGPDAEGRVYTLAMAPAPQKLWDAEPAVLCGMYTYAATPGVEMQVSSGEFPVILDWRDPEDYPMARRWTCATDATWQNCRDPHLLEHVLQFDAVSALGDRFVDMMLNTVEPTEDQIDALISSCYDPLVAVTGFEPSEEVEHYAFINSGMVICALHGAGGRLVGTAVGAGPEGVQVQP